MAANEKCPKCGSDMEHGYLIAARRISWCDHKPVHTCACGEKLSRGFWTCKSVEGFRCEKCRIIRYMTKSK